MRSGVSFAVIAVLLCRCVAAADASPQKQPSATEPVIISPADKKRNLDEILSGRFTQPIELFPFLMILLLLVLAGENLLANKFYRRKRAVA